jgi:hypothetical protein
VRSTSGNDRYDAAADRYSGSDRYSNPPATGSYGSPAASSSVADTRSAIGSPATGPATSAAGTGYAPGSSSYAPGGNYAPAGMTPYKSPADSYKSPANSYPSSIPPPPGSGAAAPGGSNPNDAPAYRPGSTSGAGDLLPRNSATSASVAPASFSGAADPASAVMPANYSERAGR